MFRVGQKVVCVDATFGPGFYILADCDRALKEGRVFTVAALGAGLNGEAAVHLEEIVRTPSDLHGRVLPYRASRFRPVAEKKADMEARRSLFRKWETHKEKRVTAPQDEQA